MAAPTLQPRDTFPNVAFYHPTNEGNKMTTQELFAGKKVIVLAIPGAATPTCEGKHIPPYQENFQQLKTAHGIDMVAVFSVNDHHVMHLWKEAKQFTELTFIPDIDMRITTACGLNRKIPEEKQLRLGEERPMRAAYILQDGKVVQALVENDFGDVDVSSYDNVNSYLTSNPL